MWLTVTFHSLSFVCVKPLLADSTGPYDAPPGYSPNPYEREGYPQQQPSAGENDGDGFSPSAQHPAADAEGGEGKEDDLPPAMHPRNEDDDIDVDDADPST